jgi:outer membrane biosynthesis protein TonB
MVDAPTPAWVESPDNDFLGSGWSSDEPVEEEPRRRRGRGRSKQSNPDMLDAPPSGGRGKLALLSVAAVAVVLGGTVVGVKFMSSSNGAEQCSGASCAAVAVTNQPGPQVTKSGPADEEPTEEPSDEPTTKESDSADSPKPSATVSARTPRRTSSPTPTPTKTKTKQAAKPTRDTFPTSTEVPTEEPTAEPTTINDSDTGQRPTDASTSDPQPTGTFQPQSAAGGQSVSLKFDVVNQGLTVYTAHLDVVNSSGATLASPTVSLPIRGRVLNVAGAGWSQDGDLLIVDVSESLTTGDSTQLTITATGRGADPANCGLVGGDCAVN